MPEAALFKCPMSEDGLCRYGGLKTYEPRTSLPFCYKVKRWVRDLEECPMLKQADICPACGGDVKAKDEEI